MPINLYTLCESKHRTIRAVTLWVRAHVVGEGGECSGRHIKFPTLMVHLGEQCLSWTPCFLSKQSLLLSLSSQVFVPVAGSQAFVPYLLPPLHPKTTRMHPSLRQVSHKYRSTRSQQHDWLSHTCRHVPRFHHEEKLAEALFVFGFEVRLAVFSVGVIKKNKLLYI